MNTAQRNPPEYSPILRGFFFWHKKRHLVMLREMQQLADQHDDSGLPGFH
jgi:hypothetical protein